MRKFLGLCCLSLACSVTALAGVSTSAPTGGATVTSPVQFAASASSPYAQIASMTINIDSKDVYSIFSNQLNTAIPLAPGLHSVYMKAWDNNDNYFQQVFTINVASSASAAPASSASGVSTSFPANGATVGSPVQFVASASSPYAPIVSMTVNVDSQDVYQIFSNQLNTAVPLAPGSHSVYMKAWDNKGNYFQQVLGISVAATTGSGASPAPPGGAPGTATVISNIEKLGGWQSCSQCAGPGGNGAYAPNSVTQFIKSPSLDGSSTQFWLGGSTPYTNALFYNQLGGRPGATHFILDFNFYIGDASVAQGIEMDIFYADGGRKNYFLTECDSRGTYQGTWQVSNVVIDAWQHTGLPCQVNSYSWNHVTLEFYKQPDGNTNFVSVSMNGNKQYVNRTYTAPADNSFQMNAAVQLDGDERQDNYSIWVDNMSITYW